jgi:hypothetical protein
MEYKNIAAFMLGGIFAAAWPGHARANAVMYWNEKAVEWASPAAAGIREAAIMHAAIFDVLNSIEPRYKPYLAQVPGAQSASKDAAVAAAAGAVMLSLHPNSAAKIKASLDECLAAIPENAAKAEGVKLGRAVAEQLLSVRMHDGASRPDAYRPKTQPGQYVATTLMVASTWPRMKPFVLRTASQFRPGAPVRLESAQWTRDYNEIKDYGRFDSTKRSAKQTETARFWLMTGAPAYLPIGRAAAQAKGLDLLDTARFMALYTVAVTDAFIAVFDAKYRYEFWRPITAIRNGDIDNNDATQLDETWQPIDVTPMHPEYPCAHCVGSGAAAMVIESQLGPGVMKNISLTSTTAPGVTHSWSSLDEFTDEVAEARIWAGFHYRFSTRAGTQLGRQVAAYVTRNAMQPVN